MEWKKLRHFSQMTALFTIVSIVMKNSQVE
jgi:hypothetical protein